MTISIGVVAAKALEVLATLGHDRREVTAAVGCTERTVARWEAGQHQPSKRNRTKLRAFIGELLAAENAASSNARNKARINRLNLAAEALMTVVEKAERVRFEQEMQDRYQQILAERQPASPSAYASVDPFELVRTGQPAEPALPL